MAHSTRLRLFKIALAGGFLLGIFFAWRLWVSTRSFPLTPVGSALPAIPFPWDYFLAGLLVLLLLALAAAARPRPHIVALLVLLLVLALGDQSRWWPSFYEYTLMFAVLAFYSWRDDDTSARPVLNTLRLIISGVYFWSGAQKLNPYFAPSFRERFVAPYETLLPAAMRDAAPYLIQAAPFLEIAFAVGLLAKRGRAAALAGALAMHIVIFFGIGPLAAGWNNSAWAWNLATAAFVVILFYREKEETLRSILGHWRFPPKALAWMLIGVLPALNFAGRWDAALAFNVYSGNARDAALYVNETARSRLPPEIERHFKPASLGRSMLLVWDWTAAEFNAGPYAELRIFKNVLRRLCAYAVHPSDVQLVVRERATWANGWSRPLVKFDCAQAE